MKKTSITGISRSLFSTRTLSTMAAHSRPRCPSPKITHTSLQVGNKAFSASSTDNSQTSDFPNHYGIQTFIPTADSVSRFFMLQEKTSHLERVLANDGHQLNALNLS